MTPKNTPPLPEHKKRATSQSMKRILWLMGIFGIFTFCILFLKLWSIQIVQHEYYEEKAIANQTSDVSVSAKRGTIYDAKGNILALSADVQNVIISPRDVVQKKLDPDLIANGLAEILSLDPAKIRKRIDKTNSAWEPIASKIEDDLADQVRQFILDNKLSGGVYLTTDSKRYYPYSSLASQVIGFVNSENKGAYGLEAIYNSDLAGENGRIVTAKNASGTEMPSGFEAYVDAQDGSNLNLTIDASIQYFAQSTVEEGIRRFEVSEGAFCIVMNPKTGAIYAMVSSPGYDLNKPNAILEPNMAAKLAGMKANASQEDYLKALGDAQFAQWRNKALNDSYEPGSTFKPIVVAAALEEGAVSEHDTYFCNGVKQVEDRSIHCSKRTGHGTQSLRQTLMNSCNPALIEIGAKLGAERFYKYWKDFGFSEKTGIELQGESESLFWNPDKFIGPSGIVNLATASFGQRFKVTPMQLITAISAVINGGHLMQPYIVQSVTDASGNIVRNQDPVEVRQVISKQTSDSVRSMMESVVGEKEGTGKNAAVAGYRIGGKTGTSQTLENYHLIVSFIGFAPADDPEVVVLLAYDHPTPAVPGATTTSGGYYISGGNMAAPMAGPLIAQILDYMGIEPQIEGALDIPVPKLTELTLDAAKIKMAEIGLGFRVVGDGGVVTAQIPAEGTAIPLGSSVVLYMGTEKPTEKVVVPNLVGRTYTAAQSILEEKGLYIKASGVSDVKNSKALSISQSVDEGVEVELGTVIEVRFTDNSVQDFAD